MTIENPFKQKLYNHTLPVDDRLWERIEAQLPADKKRFPFLMFAIASILFLTGLVVFWLSLPSDAKRFPEEKLPAPTYPLSETKVPVVSYGKTILSDAENGSYENSNTNSVTSNSLNEIVEDKVVSNNSLFSKKNSGLKSKSNRKDSQKDTGDHLNSPNVHTDDVSDGAVSSDTHREWFAKRSVKLSNNIQFLDQKSVVLLASEEEPFEFSPAIRPDPSCYKFTGEEGKSNLSVDLFITPGFAPRTYENTGNESILYAEARKRTEKAQYAWAAGGRVNLNISKEFAVRLGIMYEQAGDIFDYTDTLATQRSTRIDSFFSADGTFLYAETNTVLIFGTLIKKIHNRYHHLDIPLLASYELCMGRAIIMVNAGPVINLTSSSRGQILNPSFIPQHITAGDQNRLDAYKNNVGLSVYLGAGALIPFNKYFSGLIEPRFLYRIKPVTQDNYPLKEHRHFAGINLGIRYQFD